jgi:hypothetical protein
MLLAYCASGRFQVDGFSFLLSRGAHINARNLAGDSCLHLCFADRNTRPFSAHHPSAVRRLQSSLVFLLKSGANIHAVNHDGVSVFDLAYSLPSKTSLPGDLWDAVLAECGHDVLCYRGHWPRKPKYGHGYTRQMFEEFWEGREHLCPYYKDEFSGEINNDEASTDSDGEESGNDSGEEWHVGNVHDLFQGDGDTSDSDSDDEGGCPLG